MGFSEAIRTCFSKMFTYSGRARRAEFWWFFAFQTVGLVVLGLFSVLSSGVIRGSAVGTLVTAVFAIAFIFGMILPGLAVQIRRLHDVNCRGWWLILPLIPIVGSIVGLGLLVLFMFPGTKGDNRFGPDPLLDPDTGSENHLGEVFA